MHGIGQIHGFIGAQHAQKLLVHGDEFGLVLGTCDARQPFRLSILVAQSGKELDAAREGVAYAILCRDMRPDLDRQSTEAFVQPSAKLCLLSRHHAGLTALPAVGRKRVPAALSVGLVPAADGIIVQQKDRIRTTRNALVLSMAAIAGEKLTSL
jgi:hypothetical protein